MTETTSRIWVLGAPDPEMTLIEALLRDHGEEVIHALDDRGERVHPGNAYRCPIPVVPEGSTAYAVECIDVLPEEGWVRIDHHRPGDPGYGRPPSEFLPASSIGQVIAELARLGRLRALSRWPRDQGSVERRRLVPGELARVSVRAPGSNGTADHNAYLPGPWRWVWMVGVGYWRNGVGGGGDTAMYVPRDLVLCAAEDHCPAAAYRGECPEVDPDDLMRWRAETRAAHKGRPMWRRAEVTP